MYCIVKGYTALRYHLSSVVSPENMQEKSSNGPNLLLPNSNRPSVAARVRATSKSNEPSF